MLQYHTNGDEETPWVDNTGTAIGPIPLDQANVGFCLEYQQQPC